MTHARPFEDRLGEWLEDGPVAAPDALVETVFAAFPAIRQRRPWLVLGGRPVHLAPRLRLAVVAAVLVVATVTGARLLDQFRGPGGPPGIELASYTSYRYHYSIGHPADWSVREASRSLRADETPWADGDAVDHFGIPTDARQLIVAAANVTPGTTAADWAASTTLVICGEPTTEEPIAIGGEAGRLYTYTLCFSHRHQWAVVVHGGSAFHIVLLGSSGDTDADRRLFEQVLVSFRFTN